MKKIVLKIALTFAIMAVGFVGHATTHKASAAELTSTSTAIALSDPGTGGRTPTTP